MFYRYALLVVAAFSYHVLAQAPADEQDSVERDYTAELPRIAATEPKDALGTFEVHPDFHLELAACEPLVRDPVAVAFDEQGRMFVCEMTGYSEKRDEVPGDVRLLTDTDGDGVYDAATTYADNLPWPVAVACFKGGILVAAPPDILYCKDTNGDGVADERRVVFTGFKLNNVQGMINSFNWGLDQRIHGSSSANGGDISKPEVAGEAALSLHGRDFAIEPLTMTMSAEAGGGQHGMSFDDWGHRFVCSNSDHIISITYDDQYAGRNPKLAAPAAHASIAAEGPAADVFRISPVEPWRIVRTRLRVKNITPGLIEGGGRAAGYFTSATGVTIYRGDAWPAEYRGQAFIGDVGGNLVHRKVIAADGTALVAKRADEGREFIASTDNWFRPVQFANAPDGNLYIADMYREVIEHPDSLPEVIKKHLDLSSGSDRGRIYRIAHNGFQSKPAPDLGKVSNDELVALLSHPNAWHRETAARLIYERQDASLAPKLAEAAGHAEPEVGRLTALYSLLRQWKADQKLKASTVRAALDDPGAHVRQHAVKMSESWLKDSVELQEKLIAMIDDADPNVRCQVAFSLGEFDNPKRAQALGELASFAGDDPLIRFAILTSLRNDAPQVLLAFFDNVRDSPLYDMLDGLAKACVQSGDAGRKVVREQAEASVQYMPAFTRRLINSLGTSLRDSADPKDQKLFAETLAGSLKDAEDVNFGVSDRADAIAYLANGKFAEMKQHLDGFLGQQQAPEIQRAAIGVLAATDEAESAPMILAHFSGFGPAARQQAVEALFSRKAWTEALLGALEGGTFSPRDLDSTRVRGLQNHADAGIKARAEKVFAGDALKPREEVVQAYQDVLTMPGDKARGHEVYAKNCAQCHRVKEEGFAVGPDLATVAKAGAEKILTNVLDPNREVNQQYVNYTVNTKDLETHTGIIVADTASSVTIKRGFGETETILRGDIEEMHSEKLSIMPEGLEQTLQKQDFADLIAFLLSL